MTEQQTVTASVSLAIELNIGGQVLTIKDVELAHAIIEQLQQGVAAYNEAESKISG